MIKYFLVFLYLINGVVFGQCETDTSQHKLQMFAGGQNSYLSNDSGIKPVVGVSLILSNLNDIKIPIELSFSKVNTIDDSNIIIPRLSGNIRINLINNGKHEIFFQSGLGFYLSYHFQFAPSFNIGSKYAFSLSHNLSIYVELKEIFYHLSDKPIASISSTPPIFSVGVILDFTKTKER